MEYDNDKRRRRCPVWATIMSIFLLVSGLVSDPPALAASAATALCSQALLAVGIPEFISGEERATVMLVLGGLCFLPGSYASWVLLGARLSWPGYEYELVASQDEW
jgi:hypothetical protein